VAQTLPAGPLREKMPLLWLSLFAISVWKCRAIVCSLEERNMDDEHNSFGFGGREKMGSQRSRPFWRRYFWHISIAVLAVLLLVFASTTRSLAPSKTEDVICQSGSNNNWSGWHLVSGWKRLGGMLLNDGSNGGYNGKSTLIAPVSCQPKTMDYAVEAKIQVVTFNDNYSGFGINVREIPSSTHEPGYSTYIDSASEGGANISVVGGDVLKNAPFRPGTDFHIYRAEVKGNTITFLIDGAAVLSVVDNRYISTGEVGLWCANAQIEMSSFKVVKL
jgi:hypothetical protein